MLKIYCRFLLIAGTFLMGACTDFLDRAPSAALDKEQVFSDIRLARQYQTGLYTSLVSGFCTFQLSSTYNDWGRCMLSNLDGHSVTSLINSENMTIELLAGKWQDGWASSIEVTDRWKNCYKNIRAINIFLENYPKVPLNSASDEAEMRRMVGEAYFLRAHNYYELIKRWGGVPIIDHVISESEEQRLPRNTISECIRFIAEDCDRAAERMETRYADQSMTGRITKGAALGLKARALLLGASPFWEKRGSKITWEMAANAARDVINLKVYSLMDNYRDVFLVNYNDELLYYHMGTYKATWEFGDWVPQAIGGWSYGNMQATQEFVDCYEILDPETMQYVPYDRSNEDHLANMYNESRRDPRFKNTILHNGSVWRGVECQYYEGGSFGPGNPNWWYSGYLITKYMDEGIGVGGAGGTGGGRYVNWIFLRYADILLMYAEAQNRVGGPDSHADEIDLTARDALNLVRQRAGITDLPTGMSPEEFEKRLRNERAVEFVMEDIRFFDLKRWETAEVISDDVHMVYATKRTDGSFEYDFSRTTGPARTKFENPECYYLYPIPLTEIERNPNLTQNPGWIDIIRD